MMVLLSGVLLLLLNTALATLVLLGTVGALNRFPDVTTLQLAQIAGSFAVLNGPAALVVTIAALCGRRQAPMDGPAVMVLTALAVGLLAAVTYPSDDIWAPAAILTIWFGCGAAIAISIPTYLVSCLILRKTPLLRGKTKGPAVASPS